MSKYLYGASVQGIQSFIFETNKLKEIVGASQLVENISGKFFDMVEVTKPEEDKNLLIAVAGNIKYIFDSREDCEKIVREFPKYISNYAPGITISQAVVKLNGNLKGDIVKLEQKLKAQRNKVQMPVDIGFMALERARKTGKVAADEKPNKKGKLDVFDRGTLAKTNLKDEATLSLFKKFTNNKITAKEVPFDIEKITGKTENSWLAIIHADGNGLGNILQNLAENINTDEEVKNAFKTFSEQLEKATKEAAQKAFNDIIPKLKNENDIYPFRPVVLGGDDLTVIIRADLAYDFTKAFLKAFEEETKTHFKELKKYNPNITGLTACAGIAYIKDSYPFHYGVHLAESLVKEAKKFSKSEKVKGNDKLAPSSLAFYKVQSSFTDDLKEMKQRTHYAEESNVSFNYGPYLLDEKENFANVEELDELLKNIENFITDKSKGISKLRQWISELYKDEAKAKFMLDRIKSVNNNFYEKMNLKNAFTERTVKDENGVDKKVNFSIYNDLIQLHTFKQMYKNKKNEN